MHHGFALRYIPEVMRWSPETERSETVWLRMMSEFKYDAYQDFLSGSRFVEALLDWLQQFSQEDRAVAYGLVREHMIFVSVAELQHLVRRTFPAFVAPFQAARAANVLEVPPYLLWATEAGAKSVEEINKRSLFVGLSDGARLDAFRRANAGVIGNEQVVLGYDASEDKWRDLFKELKTRTNDENAKFEVIVLLDDFAGSGTTLFRAGEGGVWKGKLPKINKFLNEHQSILAENCDVLLHHYIGTERAQTAIAEKLAVARDLPEMGRLFKGRFVPTFDLILPNSITLTPGKSAEIDRLVDAYYDPGIMTPSLRLGGDNVKHGFATCGLPLILEHNAPNNSLALFWADSSPDVKPPTHAMRPLFRRRQRHN